MAVQNAENGVVLAVQILYNFRNKITTANFIDISSLWPASWRFVE